MKKLAVIALLVSCATPVMASNCQAIDEQLAKSLAIASENSSYSGNYNEENLNTENEKIATILQTLGKQKDSIRCAFPQAQKQGLDILTAPDNKLRAFSWDNNSGGTMHEFNQYVQYIDDRGNSQIQEILSDQFVTSLFTTTIKDKPLYILTTTGIYSTQDSAQTLNLYQIQADKLTSPKLIKTAQGLTNTLSFTYNFFSVVDRPERPIKLFEFDNKTKTIHLPVVIADKEFSTGKVTNRKIAYRFNGKYFVKQKK